MAKAKAKKKTKAKAAPKKKVAAPKKKAATKKAAPKRAAPKKAATKKTAAPKALDWARDSGIKTDSRATREAKAASAAEHPLHAKTHAAVLVLFRSVYPGKESDAQILEIDPNDFDMDPSMFYEMVEDKFGVPQDPNNEYFGGYGGPVRDLIAFLAPRWDGKLRGGRA